MAATKIDPLLSLEQAAKTRPVPTSRATIRRWVTHGIDGIRLQAVRIGCRTFVRPSALDEFQAAVDESRGAVAV